MEMSRYRRLKFLKNQFYFLVKFAAEWFIWLQWYIMTTENDAFLNTTPSNLLKLVKSFEHLSRYLFIWNNNIIINKELIIIEICFCSTRSLEFWRHLWFLNFIRVIIISWNCFYPIVNFFNPFAIVQFKKYLNNRLKSKLYFDNVLTLKP